MAEFGIRIRNSRTDHENDPGHMAVFWQINTKLTFRGYYFRITDLPPSKRNCSEWRSFLLNATVPGYIENDTRLRDDYEHRPEMLIGRNWDVPEAKDVDRLEVTCRPRQAGQYTFNPDTFPGSNNCVTWAVDVTNGILGPVLQRPRQGRIKEIILQIQASPQIDGKNE
jgi:hypothetical protein